MKPGRKEIHTWIYLFGLGLFAVSIPLSKYLMSISQFIIGINWLVEGNYKEKLSRLWNNKGAIVFLSLYVLHIVGLAYSSDIKYAVYDLKIKLPLFVIPFILASSKPLDKKSIRIVMILYSGAVLLGTFYSMYIFLTEAPDDIRLVSPLISHIRFSLNICLAFYILLWFGFKKESVSLYLRVIFVFLAVWLAIYLFITESATGVGILAITSLFIIIYLAIIRIPKRIKIALISISLFSVIAFTVYLKSVINDFYSTEPVRLSTLELHTVRGNSYMHDIDNRQTENGHYTWMYICWDELKPAWNNRSIISWDSIDQKGQAIRYTLIRFLTSKGYTKDEEGVNLLTSEEISWIEHGIANVRYIEKGSFRNRVTNLLWEYENYKLYADPVGQTMMQRLELWETGWYAFIQNPIIGVGTGDIKNTFSQELESIDSPLKNSGLRAHNQYLTFAITFGGIGFLVFLFVMLYPPIIEKKFFSLPFFCFFIIVFFSMLTEDTLESQAGATFFAFFNAVFLFTGNNIQSKQT